MPASSEEAPEVGSSAWVDALMQEINGSEQYQREGAGWTWSLGLAFEEEDGRPRRTVALHLRGGKCVDSGVVDEDTFRQLPFRLEAPYSRWRPVLDGKLEPIKSIVLRRVRLTGDLIALLKHAGATAALLDCAARVRDRLRPGDRLDPSG